MKLKEELRYDAAKLGLTFAAAAFITNLFAISAIEGPVKIGLYLTFIMIFVFGWEQLDDFKEARIALSKKLK